MLPSTLSVEELGCVKVPGQASWLSGHRFVLSLPNPMNRISGWRFRL